MEVTINYEHVFDNNCLVIIFTIAVKSSFLYISLLVSCSVRTLQTNPNQHVEYHYQVNFLVPRCLFSVYIRNSGYATDQKFQKHDMSYFFLRKATPLLFIDEEEGNRLQSSQGA
jgi:hypothetical protein